MGAMAYQITSLTIVYSTVCSGADQRKHQSSASLAFVRGFHRSPVNSPHKGPVTRKLFPFHDVIMASCETLTNWGRDKFATISHDIFKISNLWPLFGQFAAYMIKFSTTFGFTKVLFGGRPTFFQNNNLIKNFFMFYQQVMYSLHIYACVRIFRLSAVDLENVASERPGGAAAPSIWTPGNRIWWQSRGGTPSVKVIGRLPGASWL